jgi:chemotaxis protein CheD
MATSIAIGLAEVKISRNPDDVLVAFGLGSCLGIGMYDPILHLGGMLHAVLPIMNDSKAEHSKYVDSGISMLMDLMLQAGAQRPRMIIKMAGGANMLNVSSLSSTFDIGNRNIDSARQTFGKMGIKLKAEEVGGKIGRTVRLYVANGRYTIRMMGEQEREI